MSERIERLLTVKEAAERLGVSEKAVRHRIERGTLPSVVRKEDGRRMIPETVLKSPEDQQTEQAEQIIAGVPALDLLDRLLQESEGRGKSEGMRQIEAEAHGKETELREQIEQERIRANGLEQERDAAKAEGEQLREQVEGLEGERDSLRQEVEQERIRANGLEQERDAAKEGLERRLKEVEGLEGERDSLKQEVVRLTVELDRTGKARRRLQGMLDRLSARQQKKVGYAPKDADGDSRGESESS